MLRMILLSGCLFVGSNNEIHNQLEPMLINDECTVDLSGWADAYIEQKKLHPDKPVSLIASSFEVRMQVIGAEALQMEADLEQIMEQEESESK